MTFTIHTCDPEPFTVPVAKAIIRRHHGIAAAALWLAEMNRLVLRISVNGCTYWHFEEAG